MNQDNVLPFCTFRIAAATILLSNRLIVPAVDIGPHSASFGERALSTSFFGVNSPTLPGNDFTSMKHSGVDTIPNTSPTRS